MSSQGSDLDGESFAKEVDLPFCELMDIVPSMNSERFAARQTEK